eukprot:TRINITY_DN1763_c0_g1_i1.p1 TRINITY_DN1763_c0_g1~~TRINITY_DN1763_c0_g1_i1.p1  ORF type:complete len:890 (-),score=213.38 TRINITY_DN1763_c0_g1_i1:22-2616(-)
MAALTKDNQLQESVKDIMTLLNNLPSGTLTDDNACLSHLQDLVQLVLMFAPAIPYINLSLLIPPKSSSKLKKQYSIVQRAAFIMSIHCLVQNQFVQMDNSAEILWVDDAADKNLDDVEMAGPKGMEDVKSYFSKIKTMAALTKDNQLQESVKDIMTLLNNLPSGTLTDDNACLSHLQDLVQLVLMFAPAIPYINLSLLIPPKSSSKLKKQYSIVQRAAFIMSIHCLVQNQFVQMDNSAEILWVDDAADKNLDDVEMAKNKYGIGITQVLSTEAAVKFLSENTHLKECTSSQFRIITDYYRPEEGDDAAETIITWLRENGWNTPVLIYGSDNFATLKICANYNDILFGFSEAQLDLYFKSMKEISSFNDTSDVLINNTDDSFMLNITDDSSTMDVDSPIKPKSSNAMSSFLNFAKKRKNESDSGPDIKKRKMDDDIILSMEDKETPDFPLSSNSDISISFENISKEDSDVNMDIEINLHKLENGHNPLILNLSESMESTIDDSVSDICESLHICGSKRPIVGVLNELEIRNHGKSDLNYDFGQLSAYFKGPTKFEGWIINNDGSIFIEFFPTRKGRYSVIVAYKGKELSNCPYEISAIVDTDRSFSRQKSFAVPNSIDIPTTNESDTPPTQLVESFGSMTPPTQLVGSFNESSTPPTQVVGFQSETETPPTQVVGAYVETETPPTQVVGENVETETPATQLVGSSNEPGTPPTQVFGGYVETGTPATQLVGSSNEPGTPPTQVFGGYVETGTPATQLVGSSNEPGTPPTLAVGPMTPPTQILEDVGEVNLNTFPTFDISTDDITNDEIETLDIEEAFSGKLNKSVEYILSGGNSNNNADVLDDMFRETSDLDSADTDEESNTQFM